MTLTGKTLQNRYYLTEALGRGGFGHTYKAQDLAYRTNQLCVVKHLKPDNPDPVILQIARNFFAKEADALAKLGRFSNEIPSLLDRFEEGGEFFIVQEWIDGTPLSQEITVGTKFTEQETIKLLKQILEPLVFCHGEGVIHRDLKPDNIMRRHSDGKLVLIDFGAVKQLARTTLLTQSQPTTVRIGTPGFMPTEQWRCQPLLASDVYAVGAIGVFAMTGIHPCHAEFDESTQEMVWRDKSTATDDFAAVLTQMVKELPIDRFNDASAALAALNSLVTTQTPSLPSPSLKTFTFETVKVDDRGTIVDRHVRSARYLTDNLGRGAALDMVFVPGGTFMMGSDESSEEQPIHPVTVPSFYISKYPITQAQYQAIVGENPSYFKGADRPVEPVSWGDALGFCSKLSQKGKKYTLPSEAQWEYACRAGSNTPFYFGDTIAPDLVNYDGNYPYENAPQGKYAAATTPVGSFPPNAFGLYDMHGNVWEWCLDECHPNYVDAPTDGSAWTNKLSPDNNILRRLRGGSWSNHAIKCRSASRFSHSSTNRYLSYGFRVVLV